MSKLNVAVITFLLSFVLAGCSKDQKVVKWLGDGTWNQVSSTLNGTDVYSGGELALTLTYDECKLKNGDCNGFNDFTITDDLGGVIPGGSTFLYRVHEKGTKITFTTLTLTLDGTTRDCTIDCVSTWDILEMEENRNVIRWIEDNGDIWITEYQKM